MTKAIILLYTIFTCTLVAQSNSKTESLIKKLSQEKNSYMNAESVDKLKLMLDDRLIFIHSSGLTETKEEMIQNLRAGKWKIQRVVIDESNVRVFKNHTAILTGKGLFYVTSDGKELEVALYFTEVWTHFKKGWLLVSRHGSRQ